MDELARAGLIRRAVALVIDGVIAALTFLPVMMVLTALITDPESDGAQLLLAGILTLWMIGYFTILEARNGRTPGKRLLKLRVVAVDGSPVAFQASLVRNLLRIVDGQPGGLFLVAAVMVGAMPSRQRLGDLAAKTVVIVEAPEAAATGDLIETSATTPR